MKKSFSSPFRTVDKGRMPPGSDQLERDTTPTTVTDSLLLADSVERTAGEQAFPSNAFYELTIVTPTRNERDNIEPLLRILQDVFTGVQTEIIFVDDSDDDTPIVIRDIAQQLKNFSFHVHLEHRLQGPSRAGGLATAVTLGLSMAHAHYVAVIDADLQHPPEQLRIFYDQAIEQNADLVLASRYIKGGSPGGLDGFSRLFFSLGLKWIAKIVFPAQLAGVSDPLGGFFILKRSLLKNVQLRPIGYKILLEILIRCQWRQVIEIPYHFQQRKHGQSKANLRQGLTVLQHIGRLFREVPAAGRIWKIGVLILLNVAVVAGLFFLYPSLTALWQVLSIVVFVIIGLFNYLIFNQAIFPLQWGQTLPPASSLIPVDFALTAAMPAIADFPAVDAETQTAKLKTPSAQQLAQNTPTPVESMPTAKRVKLPIRKDQLFIWGSFLLVLTTLGMIGYMALGLTNYALPGAWNIIIAAFIGLSITIATSYKQVDYHRIITMLLAIAMGITFVDYLSWRVEVINWPGWWLAIPLLVAEVLGALHTLGLQCTLWPRSQPYLQRTLDPTYSPIFIFIPTVNEGVSILQPTIQGVLKARDCYLEQYPWGQVSIVICNDGYVAHVPDWQEMEMLAKSMGVQCVTREQPGGAKAGNIEHARQQVGAKGDALVIIFDADQVAKEDFLLKTVPYLADPHIGWVQTGQYYRNLENPITRWADDQQAMFYNLLCPGKATWNAAFICGTNVIIRAEALDEIGGLPQDSVTEDFAASISLHRRWKSIYLTDVLATGLGPMDMQAYLKQQRRWAMGTLQVMRSQWRDILLPQKNGLNLGQRAQYFLACTHYLCGLRDVLYLICPILFIFSGVPAVHGSTLDAFLWHFLPYFLVSSATIWYAGRGITGLRGIVMGFGCFPVLLESLGSVLLQRKASFTVTSKKRGPKSTNSYIWIYLFFAFACIAALVFAWQAKGHDQTSLVISVLWVSYTLVMLSSFLWLYYKDWRAQKAEHAGKMHRQGELFDYPARLPLRQQGLRSVSNLGIAFFLAATIFLVGSFHAPGIPAKSYPLSVSTTNMPYLGVSLPIQTLKRKPTQLAQQLGEGTTFSIIGRTQDVKDQFDTTWANDLAAQHGHPWITLQFGSFLANGKPENDASLVAIANGLHDDDLKRWAQEIRTFGQPVYLTILLHVDRNWSLSSAVANGGIPQDVPRAWTHVEKLFENLGANNITWVWSPADPAHDQAYAPPASTIDAVLLSLIIYPGTTWGDPQAELRAVMQRHPGKPVLLEVSADGVASQKAAWLTKVGIAAESNHSVFALVYHEASPALQRIAAQDKQWSMESDPASLNAMRKIAARLEKR